jgi:hypothetical protein
LQPLQATERRNLSGAWAVRLLRAYGAVSPNSTGEFGLAFFAAL